MKKIILSTLLTITTLAANAQLKHGPGVGYGHGGPQSCLQYSSNADLLNEINRRMSFQPILPPVTSSVCTVVGYGAFNGHNYAVRLELDGVIVAASNAVVDLVKSAQEYLTAGACGLKTSKCKIAGYGAFNGYNYANRILINDVTVHGAGSQEDLLAVLGTLKQSGFCQ